jgi:hypothetical protein
VTQQRLDFVWDVPISPGRYLWTPCVGHSLFGSVLGLVLQEGAKLQEYRPLRIGMALHREFAACELTPEGFLRFANRYGRLGIFLSRVDVAAAPGVSPGKAKVECFEDWRGTAVVMGEALRLWDAVGKGDTDRLAEVIRWEGDTVVSYFPPDEVLNRMKTTRKDWEKERKGVNGYDLLSSGSKVCEPEPTIAKGNVLYPSTIFVHSLINVWLRRSVQTMLIWDQKSKRSILQESPVNLFGFMALQFAKEVYSHRLPQRCQVCGCWFDLGRVPERSRRLTRSDRETCSNACRTRAYRQRQAEARRMFADGKSAKQIAKALGCKLGAVEKWVQGIQRAE